MNQLLNITGENFANRVASLGRSYTCSKFVGPSTDGLTFVCERGVEPGMDAV